MNRLYKAIFALLGATTLYGGGDITGSKELDPFYRPNSSWFDVNINKLDWSRGSELRTHGAKEDFWYIELEGGISWDWGEFYFFSDLENPDRDFDSSDAPNDKRWVIKPILDIKVPNVPTALDGLEIHIQDYYLYSDGFIVNNLVVGLAYKYTTNNFFIRPFVGLHYMHDTFNSTCFNGYMGGWTFNYSFRLFEQNFALSNWNEIEWSRKEGTYEGGDGKDWGVNGAIALWWSITDHITTGIQYRYAYQKLGSKAYQTGTIYTLKYNF